MPTLYVFAGLPGTGKTTLARTLAQARGCAYLRIDTLEQVLRDAGFPARGPEGYLIAYAVAAENLALGRDVVADSVNPLGVTRNAWRETAARTKSRCIEIEVVCSDTSEHRERVERRSADIPGLRLPTWSDVVSRDYEPWDRPHIVVETSGRSVEQSLAMLEQRLSHDEREGPSRASR